MSMQERFKHLRPPGPTLPGEFCSCSEDTPIKLMSVFFSYNPIHCVDCNQEVPFERLERMNLPDDVIKAISYWRHLYDAIDRLWLDSEDYEEWARQQLSDIHGRINVFGRDAQQELNRIHRCYYSYFQDQSADDYSPFTACPACGQPLQEYRRTVPKQNVCEECGIICWGE